MSILGFLSDLRPLISVNFHISLETMSSNPDWVTIFLKVSSSIFEDSGKVMDPRPSSQETMTLISCSLLAHP